MKLAKKGQSGQALVMALILLALGSLVITPLLMQGTANLKYHDMIQQETLRAYSADSGIEYALCEVYEDPEGYQPTHSYVINNTTVDVTIEYVPSIPAYRLTSTATSANNRSTTIETYVIIEIGLFGNAFACNGNLLVFQTTLSSPDNPGEFDIYVAGDVSLTNKALVDGDVVSTGVVTIDSTSDVSGDIIEEAELLEFPAIDAQPHRDAALAGDTFNGTYTAGGPLGPLYINGDLDIKGAADTVLEGTVYVTGNVTMDHQSIKGWGDLVAEGGIIMITYAFNPDNLLSLPLIMSINGDISLKTNENTGDTGKDSGTQAVLYAPDGVIYLDNVNVYGSVAAKDIEVRNSNINYPATLKGRADLPGAGLATISYGYK